MKFFIATFLTALTASLLFAEPGSHSPVPAEKSRPIADPGLFSAPLGGPTPLTAAEVASGNWKIDENGGCDLEKGCPYINTTTGETRYLPDSEKKKLKSPGTKDTQKASSKNQKLTEIGSKEEFDKAFKQSEDKKAIVMLFSATDCEPCKLLKMSLSGNSNSDVGIYTATRPTYRSLSGHALHEAFKSNLGNSVPVAFIYTKDETGNWQGTPVRGNEILPAIKQLSK